jgi:hypothetical protein
MSNPMVPQSAPQPPPPIPPPVKRKRFGWLALILTAVVALLLGSAIGSLGNPDTPTTATPSVATATDSPATPADEPEPEPTATTGYEPRKADFVVKVKITDKQCFGSAGCLVDYKITPQYAGSQPLPKTGVIEVTYEITGDEDPIVGSFTVEDGQVDYDKEGSMSTPRSSTKVKATVTDVEYDPNG